MKWRSLHQHVSNWGRTRQSSLFIKWLQTRKNVGDEIEIIELRALKGCQQDSECFRRAANRMKTAVWHICKLCASGNDAIWKVFKSLLLGRAQMIEKYKSERSCDTRAVPKLEMEVRQAEMRTELRARLGQVLLPSFSFLFCSVCCRPFPWCRWRLFLAKAFRKDRLSPRTDRIQAERKRCAKSRHRHAFCRIRKGKLPTGAHQGSAWRRRDKLEWSAHRCALSNLSTCRGTVPVAGPALWMGTVRDSQVSLQCLLACDSFAWRGSKCCCHHDSAG